MTADDAAAQIKSMKAQLAVLEARLKEMPTSESHSLAELRGLLRDQADTSEEEIDAVLYRSPKRDQP